MYMSDIMPDCCCHPMQGTVLDPVRIQHRLIHRQLRTSIVEICRPSHEIISEPIYSCQCCNIGVVSAGLIHSR